MIYLRCYEMRMLELNCWDGGEFVDDAGRSLLEEGANGGEGGG